MTCLPPENCFYVVCRLRGGSVQKMMKLSRYPDNADADSPGRREAAGDMSDLYNAIPRSTSNLYTAMISLRLWNVRNGILMVESTKPKRLGQIPLRNA